MDPEMKAEAEEPIPEKERLRHERFTDERGDTYDFLIDLGLRPEDFDVKAADQTSSH